MSPTLPATARPRRHFGDTRRIRDRRLWRWAVGIMVLQAVYGVAFTLRSVIIIEGERHYGLFDDSLISMRYAENLADGHGLVWNIGERVEGYTNFLWTLVLAVCHLPGWSPSDTCLLVSLLGIPVLWGCTAATVRLAQACRVRYAVALTALLILTPYYNLLFFTLTGMETGLQAILLTLALADAADGLRERRGVVRPFVWLALAQLVRPDAVVTLIWITAFVLWCARQGRWRIGAGLAVVAAVVGAHVAWRLNYYGDWLPNTYYLKATGWPLWNRLQTGLERSLLTAIALGLPTLLALAALLRARRWVWLLLGGYASAVAYQVYVGGDARPLDRFVVPLIPALAVLCAAGIHNLCEAIGFLAARRSGFGPRLGVAAVAIVAMNIIHVEHLLLRAPYQTYDENLMNLCYVKAIDRVAKPEARVALTWAGIFPYYSHRTCIDLLGKCDPIVARLPARTYIKRAGHNKFDVDASLRRTWPDVVINVNGKTDLLLECYHTVTVNVGGREMAFFVRNDTQLVTGARRVRLEDAARIWLSEPH